MGQALDLVHPKRHRPKYLLLRQSEALPNWGFEQEDMADPEINAV